MSLRVENDRVCLVGNCPVEDAEGLLQALQEGGRRVDLGQAERVHTAVVQVLLAANSEVVGTPANAFLRLHLMPILARREA